MDRIEFAIQMEKLFAGGGDFVFMKSEPEVLDFTDPGFNFDLIFWSNNYEFKLKVSSDDKLDIFGYLSNAIFDNKNVTLIGWNLKNFFSYVRDKTFVDFPCTCRIFDIKILENFLGYDNFRPPANFKEVMMRLNKVTKDDLWEKAKFVYKKIHLPLITSVIPLLETEGVVDSKNRLSLHSYYEIEGQRSGRMACQKAFKYCFNPHSILPEERDIFYAKSNDSIFVLLDYKNMEVSVLQWITGDEKLGGLLQAEDFYTELFKLITNAKTVDENQRNLCKNFFLPVVYGQSFTSLSKNLNISEKAAKLIVERIYKLFPVALNWLLQNGGDKVCCDIFGRRRVFEEKQYRTRNFLIAAPAALICLEKLIELSKTIQGYGKIVSHIHDGYLLKTDNSLYKTLTLTAKDSLESSSELCPGLKLKTSCKYGKTLADLVEVN